MKSQDDITLGMYLDLVGKENLIDILSIILKQPKKQVEELTMDQCDYYTEELRQIQESKPEGKMSGIVEIDGVKYTISLESLSNMCLGQFIDLENYLTKKDYKDQHNLISIFLKPDYIKYSDQDKKKVANKILNLPITEVMGLVDFFLFFIHLTKENIQQYINQAVKEMEENQVVTGLL